VPFPHTRALARSIRTADRSPCPFLTTLLLEPLPDDLRHYLEAWSEHRPWPDTRIGTLTLDGAQPQRGDRVPTSWKHGDYGCDDLEVSDSLPGLILGTTRAVSPPEAIFVAAWGEGWGVIKTLPQVEVRSTVIARSFEELVASEHARALAQELASALTPFL
jgi:hypothetical protein